jgi:NUDIX domain
MPLPPGVRIPEPRWPARKELKLGNQYRAYFEAASVSTPEDPVGGIYLIVSSGDRFLLARKNGQVHGIIEETFEDGQDVLEVARRTALERTGAKIQEVVMTGYLRCLATRHCADREPGSIHIRQVLLANASEVDDFPASSEYDRRRVNQRDLIQTIHKRHFELTEALVPAVSEWVKLRAQGKL